MAVAPFKINSSSTTIKADRLDVGAGSSGTVFIDNVSFLDNTTPKSGVYQLVSAKNNNIQLNLELQTPLQIL